MPIDFTEHPHRRYNPLTDEWILVSPHRAKRPWQGQVEDIPSDTRPAHDPSCYLCAGNSRAGGKQNPQYTGTYVFDNDFPALLMEVPAEKEENHPLFRAETERGLCRVICFSPHHDWTLAHMPPSDIRGVVDTWGEQTTSIAEQYPWINYVQVFENKGEIMGCSNPHPHGQIWATERLPREIQKEYGPQMLYFQQYKKRTMLTAVLEEEHRQGTRIVCANDNWTCLVPFWAIWPFEVMLIPHRPVGLISDLLDRERDDLAAIISEITIRYDNVFHTSFPYSMGFHQAPVNHAHSTEFWHLHAHFYPPLLRSATVKKFMVGYEMLGTPQRDITAEGAAARLREMPTVRFSVEG